MVVVGVLEIMWENVGGRVEGKGWRNGGMVWERVVEEVVVVRVMGYG